MAEQGKLSAEEIMEFPCVTCGAHVGERCMVGENKPMVGFHRVRVKMRELTPASGDIVKELDATDKAIIIYYAFILLADSVSAKSVAVLGKQYSSQEIQRFFAHKGLFMATNDGLIGNTDKAGAEPLTNEGAKA